MAVDEAVSAEAIVLFPDTGTINEIVVAADPVVTLYARIVARSPGLPWIYPLTAKPVAVAGVFPIDAAASRYAFIDILPPSLTKPPS
jgi:hypothetical protein